MSRAEKHELQVALAMRFRRELCRYISLGRVSQLRDTFYKNYRWTFTCNMSNSPANVVFVVFACCWANYAANQITSTKYSNNQHVIPSHLPDFVHRSQIGWSPRTSGSGSLRSTSFPFRTCVFCEAMTRPVDSIASASWCVNSPQKLICIARWLDLMMSQRRHWLQSQTEPDLKIFER